MQIQRALPLILLALSAGCATLTEKECRAFDWGELGRTDGAKGEDSTHLAQDAQACSSHGIEADAAAYRLGREEGLRQYCAPENALQLGIDGASYRQVCEGDAGALFALVHARGLVLHALQVDMRDVQDRQNAEYGAQEGVKDVALYEKLDQNARYLEREKQFIQTQYAQAMLAISSGFDPPFIDAGEWRDGLPFPEALSEAGKKFKDRLEAE